MPKILALLCGKDRGHQELPHVVNHLREVQIPLRELGALQERSPLLFLLLIGREFFAQPGRYGFRERGRPAFERCTDGALAHIRISNSHQAGMGFTPCLP